MSVKKLLLLSGSIGAGKTAVAAELLRKFQFTKISSGPYLVSLIHPDHLQAGDGRRRQLQELGDRLDEQTAYGWLVNPVAVQLMADAPDVENWLVDAVRKKRQVELFRERFGSVVRHAHLTALESVLRSRYAEKGDDYDAAISHPNEVNASSLSTCADLVLDTSMAKAELLAPQIWSLWGG